MVSASTLILFLSEEEFRDLDFEYNRIELESVWVASPKTSVTANIGYVERIGELNEDDGVLASLSGTWEMTDKIQFSAGYSLTRPPVGETSDPTSQDDSIFLNVGWQPLERWELNSGVRYSRQAYERSELEIVRDENVYSVTPLMIDYTFSKLLSFKFESRWVDRESALIARDHSYALASLGVALQF